MLGRFYKYYREFVVFYCGILYDFIYLVFDYFYQYLLEYKVVRLVFNFVHKLYNSNMFVSILKIFLILLLSY